MNFEKLKAEWKAEEKFAFLGWDFSHIAGRWESEKLPWDYREIILSYLTSSDELLDMGTGGGEFLLALNHPHAQITVTESYPPNIKLCQDKLEPLGIKVVPICTDDNLPLVDNSFDMVINRHESYDPTEVRRVLAKGGHFITQQVGGQNNYDLSQRLIKNFKSEFPDHTMDNDLELLQKTGFTIKKAQEVFVPIRFFDVGALVYFAKIIEWEFPGFSVDASYNSLCQCQKEIMDKGYVQGTEHRYIIVAQRI